MSIFDKIKNALFTRHAKAAPVQATASAPATAAPAVAAPAVNASPQAPAATSAPAATTSTPDAAATPAAAPFTSPAAPNPSAAVPAAPAAGSAPSVDVAAVLDAAVRESGQKLNWRTSIVDTMKALGLDSDLASRKELAAELNYTGDTGDSATMNVWLQKALMRKLAENGGKVPAELTD